MHKTFSLALMVGTALLLIGCGGETPLDAVEATARFGECLERNGIAYEDLEVELDDNGNVGAIVVSILGERELAYEPEVRLACTEEVELLAANG